MKNFKKITLGLLGATILSLGLYACSNDNETTPTNSSTEQNILSAKTTPLSVDAVERIVDFSIFKLINTSGNINEFKVYDIDTSNGIASYFSKIINDNLQISDINENRSIIINRINKDITYYENSIEVDITNKDIDDLMYIYYIGAQNLSAKGTANITNNKPQPGSQHTVVAIYPRKSVAEERCQALIDEALNGSHRGCKQYGKIDTWCWFGDFGCISVGEIHC